MSDTMRKISVVAGIVIPLFIAAFAYNFLSTQKAPPKKKGFTGNDARRVEVINVEKELTINTLKKRYDIVVFNPDGSIYLIVECKSPKININQDAFDQIARYNLKLNATYLMVTNGLNHYYCQMDFENERYQFLKDIPDYNK